ncbi:hypothetical protein GGTG_00678 [Gaeumannomyces tritici R3-111a-1]|uniref:Endonuclease/exonuclease/phosphatase domain-containing protein n=1 Tax=Gaeumannomyces tritici (strain R3-111a-1) TaxID=644352 RepID=J3NHE1_GAET3|nr:hypothetical protein GGTG_00678 [Gaeumannomyces tritici R3-111a-1]EJT80684.1 hypothetical protein GGTG_00678 [Gaeumannomyces tritici R3-111a-1]
MQLPTFFLFALLAAQGALATLPVRLVSWNIRPLPPLPRQVAARRPAGLGAPGGPTIIAMQEVLNNQLKDVKKGLGSDWDHVGVGRDDGKTKGEYIPILYKKTDLRLLDSTTKWLSPTPDEVSFGWGAGSRRVTTIAVLEHAATGQKLLHANCHLDNVSAQARSEGIKVVVAQIKAMLAKWGPLPVSLSGDFNSSPYNDAFRTLAGTGFMKGELFDLAQPDKVVGPHTGTYTTFSPDGRGAARIDFLWLGPRDGYDYTVQKYEIVDNLVDGVYTSDHRPVVGDVTINYILLPSLNSQMFTFHEEKGNGTLFYHDSESMA